MQQLIFQTNFLTNGLQIVYTQGKSSPRKHTRLQLMVVLKVIL